MVSTADAAMRLVSGPSHLPSDPGSDGYMQMLAEPISTSIAVRNGSDGEWGHGVLLCQQHFTVLHPSSYTPVGTLRLS